jgi:hypothetical protein
MKPNIFWIEPGAMFWDGCLRPSAFLGAMLPVLMLQAFSLWRSKEPERLEFYNLRRSLKNR